MRNGEKDSGESSSRRERLLETGFRLFAAHSIEAVKLQDVATASGVGVATLYRYFENKPNLVIEIGTRKWIEYHDYVEAEYQRRGGETMTAAENLEFYLDCYIELYRNHKDLLVFNRNFDTYVKHEGCTKEQMAPYNEAVSAYAKRFHKLYQKAKEDGTLDIRISERKLFINTMYIMLSVAGKYAEGLIYPMDYKQDMMEELIMLKNMILDTYAVK